MGVTITGKIFQEIACVFWKQLPIYQNVSLFKFLADWLKEFKQKYNIKCHMRHEKANAVDKTQVEKSLLSFKRCWHPMINTT